jgi:DNA-binding beta-propeller fold protein YncE
MRTVGAAVVVLLLAALGLSACGSTGQGPAAADVTLAGAESVPESLQKVPGPPFGVAASGRYAFVDLADGKLLVYSTSSFVPRLLRTIQISGGSLGSSITRNGRLLLISNGGQGATIVSVARAERGSPHPVLGVLTPPASAHLTARGAIETASSANGRYVFVSLEYGQPDGAVAIYDLGSASSPRFGASDYVASITLGDAVVGSTVSPDGRYLYVTSELAAGSTLAPTSPARDGANPNGTLSVISVTAAEHNPSHAVLQTVPAMNQPVRVAVTPDGSTVWVTARGSDRLFGVLRRQAGLGP